MDHLRFYFIDNKDARAISLDNELRAVKIGKMSVNEYCTKIKSMANRLKNLDCEVSEKNLVIYAVNGLDSRFATLFEIIRHREPLPSFETVRNMLLLKESSFNDSNDASTMLESSSLSPTILLASSSSDDKGNNSSKPLNNLQLCNYFSRGTYKFRDLCKFVYDHRNRAGLNSRVNTTRTTVPGQSNWGTFFGGSSNNQVQRLAQSRPTPFPPQSLVAHHVFYTATGPTMAHPVTHQQHQSSSSAHQPIVYMAQQNSQAIPGQPTSQPNNNGNGIITCTIEFDAFGFSVKDFLTRHILLRCDSSGDLYPVTKPSTIPAAFVSTSSSSWHQCLDHPGDEVLRSLSSRHLISCKKTSLHIFAMHCSTDIWVEEEENMKKMVMMKKIDDLNNEKDEKKWQSMVLEMKIEEIMCSKREIPAIV
ncbi:hypothetical protein Tco_0517398 [Tanacetum coccineum]